MSDFATPAAPLKALVEELVLGGVRHAVICPGSRSTPIALALAVEPAIKTFVLIDERSAAYFALGLAKATRRTVVVVATSGTAVVNFGPAIVEAREARVPLLLLTADRPPELRDRGAPQTIDQVHLYGRQVKWFAELPVPDDGSVGELLTRHLRGVVGRAVATAEESPRGPVQLDLPFREPLIPGGSLHRPDDGRNGHELRQSCSERRDEPAGSSSAARSTCPASAMRSAASLAHPASLSSPMASPTSGPARTTGAR